MFVGHFGIAQLGKALRREVPLAWLVIAAYLPDLVRVLIEPFTQRHDLLSHSLPIVAAFSFGIAALWQLRGGNLSAAAVLAAACVLHWPADVFTGCKPTTIHGPWIGLVSYRRPITDVLVEGSLFVGGWEEMAGDRPGGADRVPTLDVQRIRVPHRRSRVDVDTALFARAEATGARVDRVSCPLRMTGARFH